MSSQLHADHATDDRDPQVPLNRKTCLYSNIHVQKRRFQELKLGDIHFTDADSHELKTYREGDGPPSKEFAALYKSRKKATNDYVKTIGVEDVMQFTAPLRDEKHGGFNFDLQQFMWHVRDHWKNKALAWQLPEVTFTADYILAEL